MTTKQQTAVSEIELQAQIDLAAQHSRDFERQTDDLQAALGEALATGSGEADAIAARLAQARQRGAEERMSLLWLRAQLPKAQAEDRLFRAERLEKQAAALEEEAAVIEAPVNDLLKQIEKLQGVFYIAPPVGRWSGRRAKSTELRVQAAGLKDNAFHLRMAADDFLKNAEKPPAQSGWIVDGKELT
jgi:hypothetical protein